MLTDDPEDYAMLKYMSRDGRELTLPYSSYTHVNSLFWHFYMIPEEATRGILLMDLLPSINEDTMAHEHYPDLRTRPAVVNLERGVITS
jgi:hypothetical protein